MLAILAACALESELQGQGTEDTEPVASALHDRDADGTDDEDDCDPEDPSVHPGAEESCNGVDDDCDGTTDEGDWDADGDGWPAAAECWRAGGRLDCDDDDPDVHPGAVEICNAADDDCDSLVDEGDLDGDGADVCADCDDADPFRHPTAAEVCDAIDNDCDGEIDEGWDFDGDGYSACQGDCEDDDPSRGPGATETCDGRDENCNGTADDDGTCWSCTAVGGFARCDTPAPWSTAEAVCESMRATLVVIGDEAENVVVGDLAAAGTWIGATDAATEGRFVDPGGQELTFTRWAAGQPDDAGDADCAVLDGASASAEWADEPCAAAYAFICES